LETTYRVAGRNDRIRQTDIVQQFPSSSEVRSIVVAVVLRIDFSARAELLEQSTHADFPGICLDTFEDIAFRQGVIIPVRIADEEKFSELWASCVEMTLPEEEVLVEIGPEGNFSASRVTERSSIRQFASGLPPREQEGTVEAVPIGV
jgi:hypothetical protein